MVTVVYFVIQAPQTKAVDRRSTPSSVRAEIKVMFSVSYMHSDRMYTNIIHGKNLLGLFAHLHIDVGNVFFEILADDGGVLFGLANVLAAPDIINMK